MPSARCWRSIRSRPERRPVRSMNFAAGEAFSIGPFGIESRLLPHSIPNARPWISAWRDVDHVHRRRRPATISWSLRPARTSSSPRPPTSMSVPTGNAGVLNCALEVGRQAVRARAARLMLTHLLPGIDPEVPSPPQAAPSTIGSRLRHPARSWSSSRASGPRADRRGRRGRSRPRTRSIEDVDLERGALGERRAGRYA